MMININFISDEALETLKVNHEYVYEQMTLNPRNNNWIRELLPKNFLIEKRYQVNQFELKYSNSGKYDDVAFDNAITIYENLKHLPRRILSDERFWLWLYLIKYYEVSVQAIKITSSTTFLNHWTFKQGRRRGLVFGVLSREFFRVERSIDESLEDKYELTKYIFGNIERFRTLSWRAFSNQKKIVLGTLKAQRDFEKEYPKKVKSKMYNQISKNISRYGSVNLLDAASEKEIYSLVFETLNKIVLHDAV